MGLAKTPSCRIPPGKLGLVAAMVTCLLLPCVFLAVLKPSLDPFAIWNLQLSIRTTVQLARNGNTSGSQPSTTETTILPLALKMERVENQSANLLNVSIEVTSFPPEKWENTSISDIKIISLQHISDGEMHTENDNITSTDQVIEAAPNLEENQMEKKSNEDSKMVSWPISNSENKSDTGNLIPERIMSCDYSQQRSDTCFVRGDVRILGLSSSIMLASPLRSDGSTENSTWNIRPYARKWEQPTMQTIKEVTLRSITSEEAPPCAANHSVPAIVFSTGGFLGNFFHDFTDVLIPLFITSHQYQREIQFMATDFNHRWIDKYRLILNQLSRYEIINLDGDGTVHCFPQAHVGLLSHKDLGVDPTKSPNGYSMTDFREMLRSTFSLRRRAVPTANKRPRLLILQRKRSRSLTNKKEVVAMARRSGFKVIVAGPEEAKNLSRFARVVNSCDAMMGVHGAGLTNMVFLPAGSTLIQIVPWGGLKWGCWTDFGEPAADMGVRYLDYEIKEEESSLIEQYSRDDPVFTDPISVQKQGFDVLWSVFLDKQKVKLDVGRFKPVLLEALRSLR